MQAVDPVPAAPHGALFEAPGKTLCTQAGELPLEEYRLELAGHSWSILHTGAIISTAEEEQFLRREARRVPYGIALWPASIALAYALAERPLQGLRVLELGAGTGLPGIVAAGLGAHVLQTDSSPSALYVCRLNGERNAASLEQRAADWSDWHDTATYDLIIGSDILYAFDQHRQLQHIFQTNLAPGGRILIADPIRKVSCDLLQNMATHGWHVTYNKWFVSVDEPPRPIGVFELERRG